MLRNKSQLELTHLCKKIVHPLLPSFHKGQAGRIVVIGGCEDYTGAPFFAAHSAALVGADLSHVICERSAASVIKLYLPDLMVHPYLVDSTGGALEADIETTVLPKIIPLLSRMHVVIIGPGYGRDPLMVLTLKRIVEEVKKLDIPLILDADALWVLSKDPALITGYDKAILTPNVVEFQRLAASIELPLDSVSELEATISLSKWYGGVTVVRKGLSDLMVKNDLYVVSTRPGLNKRVGGQGDTLAGSIATFVAWAGSYQAGLWEHDAEGEKLPADELTLLACYAGSALVRQSAQNAFAKYGRSMQTLNVHEFLASSFDQLFLAPKL